MELFSSEFFAALAAIIVIDLVLAGDNAIVIALAARSLVPRLRKRAILWGTAGAIVVRAAMTMIVVWLLKIPGLMFFGGLMLVWIAYRLLVPKDAGQDHGVKSATGFWSAMGTIVVADAMMGLDNVLAVAGAAHGSYVLVVIGLLISIPIVVWGSQLVLRLIDRFPAITYLGAGVLALTAAKMIADEPFVQTALDDQPSLLVMLHVWLVVGTLSLAFLRNRFRRQDQLEARLLDSTARLAEADRGGARVLIPVDGSRNALEAVRRIAQQAKPHETQDIHLVHVRSPLSRHIAGFLRPKDIDAWHRDEGLKALQGAMQILATNGVPCSHHIRIGSRADTIAALATELQCDRIVMATARRNSLTRLIEDSVTQRVLELTSVPVEVIVGPQSSLLERVGVPASAVAAATFLALAID